MTMNKKRLSGEIGSRIREIRSALKVSQERMANHFGIGRPSYTKYESGENFPSIYALTVLGNNFNVSLDWLLCNKGPVFYKEKQSPDETINIKDPTVMSDVKELLKLMDHIPLLRYEILAAFHKFKMEHNELVHATLMKTKT